MLESVALSDVLPPADLRSLSETSREACDHCRGGGRTFHVKVTTKTPLFVWSPLPASTEETSSQQGEAFESSLSPVSGAKRPEADEEGEAKPSSEWKMREALRARNHRVAEFRVSHIIWDR